VPTLSDDTRTLVRKNTTRDIARMSFRIQLFVTTHKMTTARDSGPRAQPGQSIRPKVITVMRLHTEYRNGTENGDFNIAVVLE
jgi:hypothetical protein